MSQEQEKIESLSQQLTAADKRVVALERELARVRRGYDSDYLSVCEALGAVNEMEGQGVVLPSADIVVDSIKGLRSDAAYVSDLRCARERDEWHEDHGDVLWWRLPVDEPPYAGTPLDDDFPEYMTHWTLLPEPFVLVAVEEATDG